MEIVRIDLYGLSPIRLLRPYNFLMLLLLTTTTMPMNSFLSTESRRLKWR